MAIGRGITLVFNVNGPYLAGVLRSLANSLDSYNNSVAGQKGFPLTVEIQSTPLWISISESPGMGIPDFRIADAPLYHGLPQG